MKKSILSLVIIMGVFAQNGLSQSINSAELPEYVIISAHSTNLFGGIGLTSTQKSRRTKPNTSASKSTCNQKEKSR